MKRTREERDYRREFGLLFAVPDAEIENKCREAVSIITSIPEADRGAWFASLQRYGRDGRRKGNRDPDLGFYDLRAAARSLVRLAQNYWPDWPRGD